MIKFDTKEELKVNIDKYINNISNQIAMFESKQATLFMCLEKINLTIQSAKNFDDPIMLVELLSETNDYVHILKDYIHNYEILERKISNIKSTIDNDADYELKIKIEEYNDIYNKFKIDEFDFTSKYEELIQKYIKNTYFKTKGTEFIKQLEEAESKEKAKRFKEEEKTDEKPEEKPTSSTSDEKVKIPTSKHDNNSLIISEIKQRIFLPYKIEDLKEELKETDYEDIQELIDEEYTLPYNKFRLASISRFKETYKLVRHREGASFFDAIDLALELMPNNLLNPAIIAACKNLDELDIYLDCLNENELDKFDCFNIKYELYPIKK